MAFKPKYYYGWNGAVTMVKGGSHRVLDRIRKWELPQSKLYYKNGIGFGSKKYHIDVRYDDVPLWREKGWAVESKYRHDKEEFHRWKQISYLKVAEQTKELTYGKRVYCYEHPDLVYAYPPYEPRADFLDLFSARINDKYNGDCEIYFLSTADGVAGFWYDGYVVKIRARDENAAYSFNFWLNRQLEYYYHMLHFGEKKDD